MKLRSLLLLAASAVTLQSTAQTWVTDSVSMGTMAGPVGYPKDVYYNLKNGIVKEDNNSDWHLAFQMLPPLGANSNVSIIANHAQAQVEVYSLHLGASANFATLSAGDTVGLTGTDMQLYNSDSSWNYGAFNQLSGPNPFDYGWGMYDMGSHNVNGDSLYLIKTGGEAYKVWIQQYKSNPTDSIQYRFRIAKFDGTGDTTIRIYQKDGFTKRVFAYYNVNTRQIMDHEPDRFTWDFVFTRYIEQIPIGPGQFLPYAVTGILNNPVNTVAEARNVDPDTANYVNYPQNSAINEIGSDWKSFNMTTFQYEIDTVTYFIKSQISSEYYQIKFTRFDGSSTGKTVFAKKYLAPTKIEDVASNLSAYSFVPNPANNEVSVMIDAKQAAANTRLMVTDITGKVVKQATIQVKQGLNGYKLNIADLSNGMYMVNVVNSDWKISGKLAVQH